MDAVWYIDKIMQNPNNRISIHINSSSGARTVHGYVTAETTTFATTASYSDIADMAEQVISGLTSTLSEKLAAAVDSAGNYFNAGKAIGGIGKTVAGSVQKWDGSASQMPPIQLVFVALNPEDRPQDDAVTILSACLPGKPAVGNQTDEDVFFWAPNGYSPYQVLKTKRGYGGNIQGTCRLTIGQWFEAEGLLVESASFEMSKETTKAGNPLFVQGSVTFKTYRDLKDKEFEKMFKGRSVL